MLNSILRCSQNAEGSGPALLLRIGETDWIETSWRLPHTARLFLKQIPIRARFNNLAFHAIE
jgi:hypothetical protein